MAGGWLNLRRSFVVEAAEERNAQRTAGDSIDWRLDD
jgi:hypothetical protein